MQVARRPAELCPEGLLSVGKASDGVPLQSCTSSSIGISSGDELEEKHCAGQETASLTEYLRGLSKSVKDYTVSPACPLQLCLLLGETVTSNVLMGTASFCSLPRLVSPLVLRLLGSPGPACCLEPDGCSPRLPALCCHLHA